VPAEGGLHEQIGRANFSATQVVHSFGSGNDQLFFAPETDFWGQSWS